LTFPAGPACCRRAVDNPFDLIYARFLLIRRLESALRNVAAVPTGRKTIAWRLRQALFERWPEC